MIVHALFADQKKNYERVFNWLTAVIIVVLCGKSRAIYRARKGSPEARSVKSRIQTRPSNNGGVVWTEINIPRDARSPNVFFLLLTILKRHVERVSTGRRNWFLIFTRKPYALDRIKSNNGFFFFFLNSPLNPCTTLLLVFENYKKRRRDLFFVDN